MRETCADDQDENGDVKLAGEAVDRNLSTKGNSDGQTKGKGRADHRIRTRHRTGHCPETRQRRARASSSTISMRRRATPWPMRSGQRAEKPSQSTAAFPNRALPTASSSAATDTFGGLDIIVNNAGYTWDSTIQKMTDEQFQAMLDVHLVAPFRILRAAAEPIRIMAKKEAEAGREVFRKVVQHLVDCGALRQCRAGELLVGQGVPDRTDAHDVQGMGALQGQRQLRGLRPDQHPPDPADRGTAEDHRRGRTRHQGRRPAADARRHGAE